MKNIKQQWLEGKNMKTTKALNKEFQLLSRWLHRHNSPKEKRSKLYKKKYNRLRYLNRVIIKRYRSRNEKI